MIRLYRGDDYVCHGETRFKGIPTGNDLLVSPKDEGVIVPHLPREVFPEYYLVRVNLYDKIPETPLDEWIEYLKTGKVKEDTRTPGLQEVKEKLRYLSMSAGERRAYDEHLDNIMVQNDVLDTARDEGRAEGREEGREEGLVEGRAEDVAIVARNLIATVMDENMICSVTGLSSLDLVKIRKSMQ